jgi:hypothetical protein
VGEEKQASTYFFAKEGAPLVDLRSSVCDKIQLDVFIQWDGANGVPI